MVYILDCAKAAGKALMQAFTDDDSEDEDLEKLARKIRKK